MTMKKQFSVFLSILMLGMMVFGITPASAADVLYEMNEVYEGMNPPDGQETKEFSVGQAYGENYVLETVLNIQSIGEGSGRGVKFILRRCEAAKSGDMEVWLGKTAIWACTDEWKNMQNFDISPYMKKDVTVKIVVNGDTITLELDGTEVWKCADPTFAASTESVVKLGGWDTKYSIKSVSLSGIPGGSDPSGEEPENPTEIPDNGVLYEKDYGESPYEGMNPSEGQEAIPFSTQTVIGPDYVLETVIHVNSIGDGDGRGVKFILRAYKEAASGDMEVWLGKTAIWACTNEWKNMQSFDLSPYMGKDTAVKITVQGGKVTVALDGAVVWSCEDATFVASTASAVQMGGWDARYLVKSVKITAVGDQSQQEPEDIQWQEYEFPIPEMGGTSYYVDSAAAPGGDGKSPETAWNTLEQVNNHGEFLPDDKILFKRGSVWEGVMLEPKGSGVEGHPIVIDSYGEGEKPVIDRKSTFDPANGQNGSYALWLEDQNYWTIRNIAVYNNSAVSPGEPEEAYRNGSTLILPMRGGIMITGTSGLYTHKTIRGFVLENVTVANVDCMGADEAIRLEEIIEGITQVHSGAGGIALRGAGAPGESKGRVRIDDVRIENCEFLDVGGVPISCEAGWNYTDNVTNLIVRNNYIHTTPDHKMTGHGIYLVNAKEPLVEYNRIEDTANGIALQVCNGGTVQYNMVTGTDGYMHYASKISGEEKHTDGCAYDIETDDEGTFLLRGNFSANSYTDAYVAFDYNNREDSPSARNAHVIIENNISVNDKMFFFYPAANPLYTFEVRNNTVYRTAGSLYGDNRNVIEVESKVGEGAITFERNVFCYLEDLARFYRGEGAVYNGNLYFGNISRIPNDENQVNADPMFKAVPTVEQLANWNYSYCGNIPGTENFCDTDFFVPAEGSPCLSDGKQVYGADMEVFRAGVEAYDKLPGNHSNDSANTGEESFWKQHPWVLPTVIVCAVLAIGAVAVTVVLIRRRKKAA